VSDEHAHHDAAFARGDERLLDLFQVEPEDHHVN